MSDQDAQDFFGSEQEYGPTRDRYKRPLLVPTAEYPGLTPERRLTGEKVPYTRASSFSSYIADFAQLHAWQRRRLAYGLAQREDLCAMAAALPRFTNDRKADKRTNTELDEIITLAMEIGQVHEAANHGTAIHGFTEPGEHGEIPDRMKADVDSFWKAVQDCGIRILDTEIFTAHDRHRVAGTVDHLVWAPGFGKILCDKKTGDLKPLEFGVQIAEYRDGDPYNWETDERGQWPEDLNADAALIAWIPPGRATTEFRVLDLNYGRRMADLAAEVRDGHQDSKNRLSSEMNTDMAMMWAGRQADLQDKILGMSAREDMLALRKINLDWWTDELSQICKTRLAFLAENE